MKSPEESPVAPATSPSASSRPISASSPSVGARSSRPTVIRRRVLWPICITVLTDVAGKSSMYSAKVPGGVSIQGAKPARYSWSSRARSGDAGATERPQWPITSVVTPWNTLLSAAGA